MAVHEWSFRCPNCGGFFDIKRINADLPGAEIAEPIEGEVVSLQDAIDRVVVVPRIESGILGVDHVLGGGFANNSLTLLCGDPGSGKSTLVIQVFRAIAKLRRDALYITGEQTVNDIALRARSFGKFPGRMAAVRETDLDRMLDLMDDRKPEIVAIDSAQTIVVDDDLEVGSSASVKAAVRELMKFAKDQSIAIVVIGHMTKGGAIGGPRALEHFVDVNLFLAKTGNHERALRCSKNRFSEAPRHADFIMTEAGLVEPSKVDPPAPPAPTAQVLSLVPPASAAATGHESLWTAPDGTSASAVLRAACAVDGCRGKVGRACTSASGAREVGFHQSRVDAAKKITPKKPKKKLPPGATP